MFGGPYPGDQSLKGILKKAPSVTFSNDTSPGIQANQAGVYIPMSQLPFIQNPNFSNQSNFQIQQPIRNLLDENFSHKSNNKLVPSNTALNNNNPAHTQPTPSIKNTEMSMMPIYNAKWKDGMMDAYKEQINQLSQAMYQLQVQNQQTAKTAEVEKIHQMTNQGNQGGLHEAMEGQRRMFDMYWELSKRCKHVEEVTKKQAELITSMNEMMERREAQHRREIDRLRDEIYRLRISGKENNVDPRQDQPNLHRHPSSAPSGRPFVESIEQFHRPQPPVVHQRPPAYPKRHQRVPRLRRHRDDSYYSNPELSDRAMSPKLAHTLSQFSNPNRNARRDSQDLYPDGESSDAEGDYARDQIRTKNKLKGIEGKIMELKLMTQDM